MDYKKEMDSIRKRLAFIISRIPARLAEISDEIGITSVTLHKFLDGGNIQRITLIKVREFCEAHEKEYGWDLLH